MSLRFISLRFSNRDPESLDQSPSEGVRRQVRALLRFFDLARVLVRLDHVASFVINANYNVNRSAGRETTEPKLGFFLVWVDNTV